MSRSFNTGRTSHTHGSGTLDRVRLRRWLRVLIPLHTSPRRIALGVSIGVLIAFSPFIGFQMGLALVLAAILNASRIAAVAGVWVTNPVTMGPIFALTYAVGRPFWFTSPDVGLSELSQAIGGGSGVFSVVAVFTGFQSIFGLGSQIVMPMIIGGLLVGAVAGALCYLPVRVAASTIHRSRRRKSRGTRSGFAARPYSQAETRISTRDRETQVKTASRRAA